MGVLYCEPSFTFPGFYAIIGLLFYLSAICAICIACFMSRRETVIMFALSGAVCHIVAIFFCGKSVGLGLHLILEQESLVQLTVLLSVLVSARIVHWGLGNSCQYR